MQDIKVFFGDDETRIPSERVENENDDLSLEFTCQKCGQMNRVDLEAAHKQLPTTINCKSGCVVTVRLYKEHEDRDYLLQVAAVERDPEGLIPMIFHVSGSPEYMVSVGKWLIMPEGRPDEKPGENSVSSVKALLWKAADGTYTQVSRRRNSDAGNMHLEEFYATQRSAKDLVELRLILKETVDHTGLEDMAVPALLMTDLIREAAKKDACLADAMTLRGIEIHE